MKCHVCGTKMVSSASRDVLKVGGHVFETKEAAQKCPKCGEIVIAASEVAKFERAVAMALARSGEMSGEAVKFMRKQAGVSAVELAKLLDVAPETVSRWETGKKPIPRAAFVVVAGLVDDVIAGHTAMLDRLRSFEGGPKLKRMVQVALKA